MLRSARSATYVPAPHVTRRPTLEVDFEDPAILEPGEGVDWTNQDSARLRSLDQALAICRLLAEQELDLYQLAKITGLGQRTCRRYVYALQLAGLDIVIRRPPGRDGLPCTYRLDRRSWHGLLHLPID